MSWTNFVILPLWGVSPSVRPLSFSEKIQRQHYVLLNLPSHSFSTLFFFRGGGSGIWQPTPVLLPGKSHGQRSMVGYSPWGLKQLDTTERLHFLWCFIDPGEPWLLVSVFFITSALLFQKSNYFSSDTWNVGYLKKYVL